MRILLVVYDNESYIHFFPSALGYIAAVLKNNGYDVEIYSQDKNHYPDDHLTEYLDKNRYDIIGVSVTGGYYQYRKLIRISNAINKSKNRPFYVLGGHGPSPEPEFFLRISQADAIVIGEGEETIIELVKAIEEQTPLSKVKGIAYKTEKRVIINKRRPLIKDVDTIPFPAYHLFPVHYYRLQRPPYCSSTDFVMDLIGGRGCKFRCNFCYRLDKGFRPRSVENIIEEINLLKRDYGITYIIFQDELLMSSKERMIDFSQKFIRAKLNIKWNCNGRLNYAEPETLSIMKKAGCVFINYGIEALDNNVLKNMNKGLSIKTITKGVENTLEAGISPGLNILFGNIGDNKETLNKGLEFLLKYGDGGQLRTIRPVTPYPGSPLYYHAIKMGLLKDCEEFYEKKHLNSDLLAVNFTDLRDDEFYGCLLEANSRLINNYYHKQLNNVLKRAKKLYLQRDVDFRGFRQG